MNNRWILWVAAIAGFVDKRQLKEIEFKDEEIKVLKEIILRNHKRIPLSNDQRRRLAVKAKELGREHLFKIGSLFMPDTLLAWYRKLVAEKYNGQANKHGGRAKLNQAIVNLILKFSDENPSWGYTRIRNVLKNLGHIVGRTTVREVLRDHGRTPGGDRTKRIKWRQFIASHLDVLCSTDFFTIELLTLKGLKRVTVMFVVELSTRRVHLTGLTSKPCGKWMDQMARNLTDCEDGFLKGKRYLIHDRDPLFTKSFRGILKAGDVKSLKLPVRSPDLNAVAERTVFSIKHEALNHFILTSEEQLEYILTEYLEYFHRERPHEWHDGEIIDPWPQDEDGEIVCFKRLGGLLKSYRRVKMAA